MYIKLILILLSFTLAFIGVVLAVHFDKTIGILIASSGMISLLVLHPNNNN